MNEKKKIKDAAKLLFNHKLNKSGLKELNYLEPKTISEAYNIQDELKVHYLS